MVALSRSAEKEAEARGFGTAGFVVTSDDAQMQAARRTFDVILNTASGRAPLDPYFELMKPLGRLVCVSLPDKEERSQLYLHSAVPPSARSSARISARSATTRRCSPSPSSTTCARRSR